MRIETDEQGILVLKEVFSGVGLKAESGDYLGICMRDDGFEIQYHGVWYSAKNGILSPLFKLQEG